MIPQRLRITSDVYEQIKRSIGTMPPEQGGALGGSRSDFIVRHFYFDRTAIQEGSSYSPDYLRLNRLFRDRWNPAGINLLGFVHSHPLYLRRPSSGDLAYAHSILNSIPALPYLLLPIVIIEPGTGEVDLYPYAVVREGKKARLVELFLDVINTQTSEVDMTISADSSATSLSIGGILLTIIRFIIGNK